MIDEFEITATGKNNSKNVWYRSSLHVATVIADKAVEKLGYSKAVVENVYGGDRSEPLYTVEEDNHEKA